MWLAMFIAISRTTGSLKESTKCSCTLEFNLQLTVMRLHYVRRWVHFESPHSLAFGLQSHITTMGSFLTEALMLLINGECTRRRQCVLDDGALFVLFEIVSFVLASHCSASLWIQLCLLHLHVWRQRCVYL